MSSSADPSRPPLEKDLDRLVVFNLVRTTRRLAPLVNSALQDQEVTSTQLNALMVLQQAGADGLTMGDLGRQLVVSKSNITALVGRLEKRGMVNRRPGHDRRSTRLHLTLCGRKILRRSAPQQDARLQQLTGCLQTREKTVLIRLLSKLRRELRRYEGGRA